MRPGTTASTRSPSSLQSDPDTAYNAFEAGEGDNATIPPGRWGEAQENYANTLDVAILGTRTTSDQHRTTRSSVAPENVKLRQAIILGHQPRGDQRGGLRRHPHRSPPSSSRRASRASTEGICEYCAYDPEAGQAAFEEWKAAGNSSAEPHQDPVQRRRRPRARGRRSSSTTSTPVGIEAVAEPLPDARRTSPSWPTAPASSAGPVGTPTTRRRTTSPTTCSTPTAIGGNNHGPYSNPEFDALIDEAKQTIDPTRQADAVPARPRTSCSTRTSASIPINCTTRRLRVRRREDRRVPADQLRPDPVGAGRAQGLILPA